MDENYQRLGGSILGVFLTQTITPTVWETAKTAFLSIIVGVISHLLVQIAQNLTAKITNGKKGKKAAKLRLAQSGDGKLVVTADNAITTHADN